MPPTASLIVMVDASHVVSGGDLPKSGHRIERLEGLLSLKSRRPLNSFSSALVSGNRHP